MFDVFTEEIEILIKDGISNLYWFKGDLKKAWLRSGVNLALSDKLFLEVDNEGRKLTKRQLMDKLYEELRNYEYNRRLEISRNFVRILVEHKNFIHQDEKHKIEIAERCALKLSKIIQQQNKEKEYQEQIRIRAKNAKKETYSSQILKIREEFIEAKDMQPQKRGYALEKIFANLMNISGIPVEESLKIAGEQIDGAIKYDGHYYLIELRWINRECNQTDISSLYLKAEGKLETRGLFFAMNGYSKDLLQSLPKGKNFKVLLFNGMHLSNVIFGNYTFNELLEHAISQASIRGEIFCNPDLKCE